MGNGESGCGNHTWKPERAAAVAASCEIWSPRWQRGGFDAIPAGIERALEA